MLLRTSHSGKMLTYATLSLVDLYLTYTLVQSSGGLVYESNPVANAWLARYGWTGLAVFKLAAMLLVTLVVTYISCYRPQTADRILRFACCAVAFVVVYSFWLINSCGGRHLGAETSAYERTMLVAADVPKYPIRIEPRAHERSKQGPRVQPGASGFRELPLRKAAL